MKSSFFSPYNKIKGIIGKIKGKVYNVLHVQCMACAFLPRWIGLNGLREEDEDRRTSMHGEHCSMIVHVACMPVTLLYCEENVHRNAWPVQRQTRTEIRTKVI